MSITTKKIQIVPVGDKEEVNRVYTYLRDGIYNQHRILNTYMSQVGCLYFSCGKDYKSEYFKEEMRKIFRNTNEAIKDIPQAKGLGMAGACGMRVKKDFSTALKNGLAKGDRRLPEYKRDFPLLVKAKIGDGGLHFYSQEDVNGEGETYLNYYIKFVNGITFRVFFGTKGRRDFYLPSLLDGIVNYPDEYKVCDSTIQIDKGKIILNLVVNISKAPEAYKPVKGRCMSVVLGYNQPLVVSISDADKPFYLGVIESDTIVDRRLEIQNHRRRLQMARKMAKGGHGRDRKMRNLNQQDHYEKNVMKNFNHILSKAVVNFAKQHKVETIVIDDMSIDEIKQKPIVLRNWSFFELETFIIYKAKALGIETVKGKIENRNTCSACGNVVEFDTTLVEAESWEKEPTFKCPCCKKEVSYRFNKARLMLQGK